MKYARNKRNIIYQVLLAVFCDVTACSFVERYKYFRGMCCLQLEVGSRFLHSNTSIMGAVGTALLKHTALFPSRD
jgi:hypothetical protein